jgi:hypothetical protein
MTDLTPRSNAGDEADLDPNRGATAGTPRWMKVVGISLIVLVVLIVIVLITGGGLGGHGPSMHN